MTTTADSTDQIRSVLKAAYPGWTGSSDPRFVSDEVEYKREAIELASTRLSRSALADLIERHRFTEVIERLDEIGHETNLLYLSTPRAGDLNILYDPSLDQAAFASRILDLLHGEGTSPERLERYATWVEQQGLPNKWTFPTYFLFLVHPEDNLFVKPRTVGHFMELVEPGFKLGSRPTGDLYARLLAVGRELRETVLDGGGKDMVPVQSVMWVVGRRGYDIGVQELDGERQETLLRLLEEFGRTFVQSEEGAAHLATYPHMRAAGQKNYREVVARRRRART